jgi:hypothetical protein
MAKAMTGAERERAKAIGAGAYFRGKRFRTLKEDHIFAALDAAVKTMQALKFPDPFNGRVLGGLAAALIAHDEKSLGDMRQRKIKALTEGSKDDREELLGLIGLEVSERYLAARKDQVPAETRLVPAESLLDRLGGVFEEMEQLGRAMGQVSVMDGEEALVLTKDKPDAGNVAEALIGEVVGSYEALIPLADEDGNLPDIVQRRAVAKAAFLRLGIEDLAELVAERDIENVPTRAAMAKALAELYQDDLREVARLTLQEREGDPAFGFITRLLPLTAAPDLRAARSAFQDLRGHFLEVRPAVFFVFGSVTLSRDEQFLTIEGAVRSFSVIPVELAGEPDLNSKPRKDDIRVLLRPDQKWATVTARRASDLSLVGAVLRRSGEVFPAPGVVAPDPLTEAPFNTWDPRSLWILDFFRRDLQVPALRLQETIMANFDSPDGRDPADDEEHADLPRLASVKLRGQRLQDHPEVCSRIVERAHLKDVEFRIRKVVDQEKGFATLTRVRVAWERDHIAVLTGADGDNLDLGLHQRLVQLVRDAAERPLSSALVPILQRVEKRAQETDVGADAEGVITGPDNGPPESDAEITVAPAEKAT